MGTRSETLVPARATHPGEVLREELRERGIKQKDFARAIGMQATHLSEFIRGKRNMSVSLAMRLEAQLGIPYKTWMELHYGYMYDCKALEERRSLCEGPQQGAGECAEREQHYPSTPLALGQGDEHQGG